MSVGIFTHCDPAQQTLQRTQVLILQAKIGKDFVLCFIYPLRADLTRTLPNQKAYRRVKGVGNKRLAVTDPLHIMEGGGSHSWCLIADIEVGEGFYCIQLPYRQDTDLGERGTWMFSLGT